LRLTELRILELLEHIVELFVELGKLVVDADPLGVHGAVFLLLGVYVARDAAYGVLAAVATILDRLHLDLELIHGRLEVVNFSFEAVDRDLVALELPLEVHQLCSVIHGLLHHLGLQGRVLFAVGIAELLALLL